MEWSEVSSSEVKHVLRDVWVTQYLIRVLWHQPLRYVAHLTIVIIAVIVQLILVYLVDIFKIHIIIVSVTILFFFYLLLVYNLRYRGRIFLLILVGNTLVCKPWRCNLNWVSYWPLKILQMLMARQMMISRCSVIRRLICLLISGHVWCSHLVVFERGRDIIWLQKSELGLFKRILDFFLLFDS